MSSPLYYYFKILVSRILCNYRIGCDFQCLNRPDEPEVTVWYCRLSKDNCCTQSILGKC